MSTFIDLCCGIGGFHQALATMGMRCVLASDIDENCRKNYELNYGIRPHGDLAEIEIEDIPDFDVLCAGFPCQPFSKAGDQRGFKDTRGNIFFNICAIVEYCRPKYIILENVRNLASHDRGNTWTVIKSKINDLGYATYEKPVILNALYFGVPQSRERVVIMCKRKDLGDLQTLPKIARCCVKEVSSLESILEHAPDAKYTIRDKSLVVESVWNDFVNVCHDSNITVPKFPVWTDWWDGDGIGTSVTRTGNGLTDEQRRDAIKKAQHAFYTKYKKWIDQNREFYTTYKSVLEPWLIRSRLQPLWKGAVRKLEWQVNSDRALNMRDVLWSTRGSGVRVKNADYTPTLVAMTSMIPIYGPMSRMLTPRECARLQSFPDKYIIHDDDKVAYKQFGNAVNVKMIERCARFLIHDENLF